MPVNADFSILQQPNSFQQNFQQGMQLGTQMREQREKRQVRNALAELVQNPSDESSLNDLIRLDPRLGMQMQDRQKDRAFSAAAGDYYRANRAPPTPQAAVPGSAEDVNSMRGEVPAPQLRVGQPQVEPFQIGAVDHTIFDGMDEAKFSEAAESLDMVERLARSADHPRKWDILVGKLAAQAPEFQRYVGQFANRNAIIASIGETKAALAQRRSGGTSPGIAAPQQQATPQAAPQGASLDALYDIDPIRAQKFQSEQSSQKAATLKRELEILQAVDSGYDLAIETLSSATDEASYQRSLELIDQRFAPLGVNVRERAPANYPGPDGIRQILQSSMAAKEQIAAQDRQLRLDNDIADDAADNARADRNTENLISTRNQRVGISQQREARIGSKPRGSGRKPKGRKSGGRKPVKMKPGEQSITLDNGQLQVIRGRKWVNAK